MPGRWCAARRFMPLPFRGLLEQQAIIASRKALLLHTAARPNFWNARST